MLRIFTFLRNAFEPPSEKERRLLYVHQRSSGRTPQSEETDEPREPLSQETTIHSSNAEEESAPLSIIQDTVHNRAENIEHGEAEREEEHTGEQSAERADNFKNGAQTLQDRMNDIVRWLDDVELRKQFEILQRKKPEFATFIAAVRQNADVYRKILAPGDGTDEETADTRSYHDFLQRCIAGPLHGSPEELQDARNKLKIFEDIVNPEWEYLTELIPQLHRIHDNDPDAEEGKSVITLWTLWSMGLAAMKMWEAAEKAYKEKKEREATTFAYNMAKKMGMEKWNPEMFFVLERDMFDAEDKATRMIFEQAKGTDFDDLIPLDAGGKFSIQIPKYRNVAILQAAAERGQLYQIDEARKMVFDVPFESLVPETWLKNKAKFNAEWQKLIHTNTSGIKKEQEEGQVEARTETKAIKLIDFIEKAAEEKRYWKIYGIVEWAVTAKVQIGEVGALVATRINRLLREDTEFARFASGRLFHDIGSIAQRGLPEASLLHLKIDHQALAQFGTKRELYNVAGGGRMQREFSKLGVVPETIIAIENQLQHIDGRLKLDLSAACNVFRPDEIQLLGGMSNFKKYTQNTEEGKKIRGVILDKAVAKVLAGQFVITTDGKCISIYNDDEYRESYEKYRNFLEFSGGNEYPLSFNVKEVDPDHYITMNEGKLISGERMRKHLFQVTGPATNPYLANEDFVVNNVRSIAKFDKSLTEIENVTGISPEERQRRQRARIFFRGEMKRRLDIAIGQMIVNNAEFALKKLANTQTDPPQDQSPIPDWLQAIFTEGIQQIKNRTRPRP